MKKKVYEAIKAYVNEYKDFDDVRLVVDSLMDTIAKKHPRQSPMDFLKPACVQYVADGNLACYPCDQFNDLVNIFKTAGEKFKPEVYLKKPAIDEIKKYGFDEWFEKYNNLSEHYELFKQTGRDWTVTHWYQTLIGLAISQMYLEYDN